MGTLGDLEPQFDHTDGLCEPPIGPGLKKQSRNNEILIHILPNIS